MSSYCRGRVYKCEMNLKVDEIENYEAIVKNVFKTLSSLKYGIYCGFGCVHEKPENPHIHFSFCLRDENVKIPFKELNEFFQTQKLKLKQLQPVKAGRKAYSKLLHILAYCLDQSKHPDHPKIDKVYYQKGPAPSGFAIKDPINLTKLKLNLIG